MSRGRDTTTPPAIGGGYFVEQFVPSLLNQVTNTMNQRFKVALKNFGLSLSQWRALAALTTGDDLSLTAISELTSINQPTLSRVIDQLVQRGLIAAAPRRSDGRFVAISLTPAGRDVVADVWPIAWQHSEGALADLTVEENDQLRNLLTSVLQTLRAG
jgi:DNA-binding MarR family transcriptional regulator